MEDRLSKINYPHPPLWQIIAATRKRISIRPQQTLALYLNSITRPTPWHSQCPPPAHLQVAIYNQQAMRDIVNQLQSTKDLLNGNQKTIAIRITAYNNCNADKDYFETAPSIALVLAERLPHAMRAAYEEAEGTLLEHRTPHLIPQA